MTKIDSLRRVFLPCFTTTNHRTTTTKPTIKKRLSTSLRDDIIIINNNNPSLSTINNNPQQLPDENQDQDSDYTSSPFINPTTTVAPPRSSKTMVIGTIFGHRRGHVYFCVQHDRLKTKPSLLLQLSIQTQTLVREMRSGLVRLALESTHTQNGSDLGSCPLRSVPVWTMFCNGRKLGFAVRKKASERIRVMLKSLQSTTNGAGVIPSFGFDFDSSSVDSTTSSNNNGNNNNNVGELIYMRANYECIVGGPDSESFHLINPDGCLGNNQELSIFLMRSSR